MVIRDYLNVGYRADMRNYLLAQGQAVAVVGVNVIGDIPQETWYFDENSMAVDDGVTVMKPNELLDTEPGRYHINMVQADWNMMFNKPEFSAVALSGNYNDLNNKLTAGAGIVMNNNSVAVDSGAFMSVATASAALTTMQTDVNSKTPLTRTVTINGLTQDLSSNRSWQVGNVSTDGTYNNPAWLTSLAYSKLTGTPTSTTVTRPINSTTYTISATKSAVVRYNIKITCTATIGSAASGKVLFQYSTNGGTTWIDAGEVENSNTVTLAITLNSITTQTGFIVWEVPANALCRMVSTSTGTTTITYVRGQETY